MIVHQDIGFIEQAGNAEPVGLIFYSPGVHGPRKGERSPADQKRVAAEVIIDELMP